MAITAIQAAGSPEEGRDDRVLVLNCGSSSVKYRLYDGETVVDSGTVERVGEPGGGPADHAAAVRDILGRLDLTGLTAVGHRVVHGGRRFSAPVADRRRGVRRDRGAGAARPAAQPGQPGRHRGRPGLLPDVAAGGRLRHRVPPHPARGRRHVRHRPGHRAPHDIRRYGFHGTSHAYVSQRTAELLGRPYDRLHTISLHLGNGASACAVDGGRSVATSMGMSPLEGLVMGTRSGDLDPTVVFHLRREGGLTVDEIDDLLNHRSGLLGLTGANDMREVLPAGRRGRRRHPRLRRLLPADHRVRRGVPTRCWAGADAVTFTAGVGEHPRGAGRRPGRAGPARHRRRPGAQRRRRGPGDLPGRCAGQRLRGRHRRGAGDRPGDPRGAGRRGLTGGGGPTGVVSSIGPDSRAGPGSGAPTVQGWGRDGCGAVVLAALLAGCGPATAATEAPPPAEARPDRGPTGRGPHPHRRPVRATPAAGDALVPDRARPGSPPAGSRWWCTATACAACPSLHAALATRWAAAGFVVAAPTYPYTSRRAARFSRADVRNQPADAWRVIRHLVRLDARTGDPLAGHLDVGRFAATGHSAGGFTTAGMFTSGHSARLRSGVIIAGGGLAGAFAGPTAPLLFVHGTADPVVPLTVGQAGYQRATGPKAVPQRARAGPRRIPDPGPARLRRGRRHHHRLSPLDPLWRPGRRTPAAHRRRLPRRHHLYDHYRLTAFAAERADRPVRPPGCRQVDRLSAAGHSASNRGGRPAGQGTIGFMFRRRTPAPADRRAARHRPGRLFDAGPRPRHRRARRAAQAATPAPRVPAGTAPAEAFAVGVRQLKLNRGGDRPLPVTLWYPAPGRRRRGGPAQRDGGDRAVPGGGCSATA